MCNTSQGFYGASTSLSPAAQAVMDAVWREIDYAPRLHVRWAAIAALRAAADLLKTCQAPHFAETKFSPSPPSWRAND